MAVAGALIGGAIGAFGKKPKVPTLTDISPDLIQKETALGNIANFGDIAKLATMANTLNQEQLNSLVDKTLGAGTRDLITGTIQSRLKGELAPGTVNAITRYNAGRNVGALTAGSGFSNRAGAALIGSTAEQQISEGLSSAESWLSRASAPQMDVTQMFFSPQQRLASATQQQSVKFQRDLMAAQVKAAPDPARAALGAEIDRFFNTMVQTNLSMGGMMGSAAASGAGQYAAGSAGGASLAPSGGGMSY